MKKQDDKEIKVEVNKTILVIEDNEECRFLIEDMLSDEGYEVVTAANGSEVEQKMVEQNKIGKLFDLLLVDIVVPGFKFVDFIKDHINTHRILVVSAYIDSFDLKGILDKRWKIKKPFYNNDLIAMVKKRLDKPIKENNCNHDFSSRGFFCVKCGVNRHELNIEEKKICGRCGKELNVKWLYCNYCSKQIY